MRIVAIAPADEAVTDAVPGPTAGYFCASSGARSIPRIQ
jgi:hypothetical protein